MKPSAGQVERFLRRPDPRVVAVLVYGADEGLVRERVERLVAAVLDDPRDPFRYTELAADLVRSEPGRLLDEARALSMVGGRRVVRLRQASDQLSAACRSLLALEGPEALVVLDAGELGRGSSLRRLMEDEPNAAAIACYRDEGRDLASSIDRLLRERGMAAEGPAREFLVEHLGADRGITRSELDKLDLYLGEAGGGEAGGGAAGGGAARGGQVRTVTLDDAAAVVGDSAALTIDDLVHATTLGRPAELIRILDRLLGEGEAPVRLLRSVANHLARLHHLAGGVAAGEAIASVLAKARPPVHFRRKDSFRAELARWSTAGLARALGRLIAAEIACKTTGQPDDLLCRTALLTICREVAEGRAETGRRASARHPMSP